MHNFAGETVRIIVGFAPGGGYDLYARLTAGHLGRHLPGNPAVVVENMPGAGAQVATNYLAGAAHPDGLTIGLLVETSAADAIESNLLDRLRLLVSPSPAIPVLVFSARSGIASVDDWRRAARPPRIASSGSRAQSFVVPRIASSTLGLPVQIVTGYSGSAEMRLAIEGGEADGLSLSWDTYRTLFSASDFRVVLRFSSEPLPDVDAPDAMTLASNANARALLETGIYAMTPFTWFYAAPRDTPATRLTLLREGLSSTFRDPQFLEAARVAGLTIAPVTGEALEERLRLIATRPEVLVDLRSILRGH